MKLRYVVRVSGGVTRRGHWVDSEDEMQEDAVRARLATKTNDVFQWHVDVQTYSTETSE